MMVLLFLLCALCTFRDGLSMERFVIRKSVQSQFGDKFNLSEATCHNITDKPKCSEFGATVKQHGSPCECECPLTKSSFIYRGGKWSCIDDLAIRKQENCAVHAGAEDPSTEQLRTRGEGQVRMWNIRTMAGSKITCGVNTQLSTYLSCFNGWTPIKETGRIEVFVDSSTAHLRILPPSSGELDGRIVKIVFNSGCAVATIGNRCLLFKLEGQAICSYLPLLPSSSSIVVQPTSSVSEFASVAQSSIVPNFAIASRSPVIVTATSTSKYVVEPSTENDNVRHMQIVNSTLTFLSGARPARNDNMLLHVGLGVASLFIPVMIIILIITCHRCRTHLASRKGTAVIQTKRRNTSDSITHLDQFFTSEVESESSATWSDEVFAGQGIQNLGHITLFRLDSHDVTWPHGKGELPRVYACADERFKSFGIPEKEGNEAFALLEDIVPTFSTFLDSFQKEEKIARKSVNSDHFVIFQNSKEVELISDGQSKLPFPPPTYENRSYEKGVDDEEDNKHHSSFYAASEKSTDSRNRSKTGGKATTLENTGLRMPHILSKREASKENCDHWQYEMDGKSEELYTNMKGAIAGLDTPSSNAEFASEPVNNRHSIFSLQKLEGMEVLAGFTSDVPTESYPLYDFSFELVTE